MITIASCTLAGLHAAPVSITAQISPVPGAGLMINGLGVSTPGRLTTPSIAARETSVRVRGALAAIGRSVDRPYVISAKPLDLKKHAPPLDLAIACAVLAEATESRALEGLLVIGELGLDGGVRKVSGLLAACELAQRQGLRGVLAPVGAAREARLLERLAVFEIAHLFDVWPVITGAAPIETYHTRWDQLPRRRPAPMPDMSEIRGNPRARRALEIAAAGGHALMLNGAPGTGKTMLARRLPSILPTLTHEQILETTRAFSAVGLAEDVVEEPPFRAPHYTISTTALLGAQDRPGETALAHNGVLFLDEVLEFRREALEAVRDTIDLQRAARVPAHLPAAFQLVTAANPCPCGWRGTGVRDCMCSPAAIERYRARLDASLFDRIDLRVEVESVALDELRGMPPAEDSATIRARVVAARTRQHARGVVCNARMDTTAMLATCRLDEPTRRACDAITDRLRAERRYDARTVDRLLRVARTIADLEGALDIAPAHLEEVAGFVAPVTLAPQAEAVPQG